MTASLDRVRALRMTLSKETREEKDRHSLGELLALLDPLELSFAGILFSAPFLQPVPVPGLSTPIGLSLAALALLRILGHGHMALPRRLRDRHIEHVTILKILGYAEIVMLKLSKFPHWDLGRTGRFLAHPRALSAHIAFLAMLLALPLPIPFSNTVPAWGIVFACLAMLESNGIFIFLSYLTLIANVVFFGGLLVAAIKII